MKPLTLIITIIVSVFGNNIRNDREARWFRGTYTETKVQKEIVTSLMPSSCVRVDATLPPCRSVRNLNQFPEFAGSEIYPEYMKGRQLIYNEPKPSQIILAPVNSSSYVGWGEYLGLVAPTITVTAIELQTTAVLDPRTVVTFSVKGCRPSRLPLDLNACPPDISPSSSAPNLVVPTARNVDFDFVQHENYLKQPKNIDIEPSTGDIYDGILSSIATEELSNVELTK